MKFENINGKIIWLKGGEWYHVVREGRPQIVGEYGYLGKVWVKCKVNRQDLLYKQNQMKIDLEDEVVRVINGNEFTFNEALDYLEDLYEVIR